MSYIRSLVLLACCAPPLGMAQVLQPALLQEDFRILRSALEEGHPEFIVTRRSRNWIEEILAGRDKEMETALELIKRRAKR